MLNPVDHADAFSGFLYRVAAEDWMDAARGSGLRPQRPPADGWLKLRYTSAKALIDADEGMDGPFEYPLLITTADVILANDLRLHVAAVCSRGRKVVEDVRSRVAAFGPRALRRVVVKVDELVNELMVQPDYLLSGVNARTPAYGAQLRTMSFYGDDVASAAPFQKIRASLNCYGCSLRLRNGRKPEFVRFGGDGVISFASEARANDIYDAIHYVARSGFIVGQ